LKIPGRKKTGMGEKQSKKNNKAEYRGRRCAKSRKVEKPTIAPFATLTLAVSIPDHRLTHGGGAAYCKSMYWGDGRAAKTLE